MENSARLQKLLLSGGIGFIAGAFFTWLVGYLDAGHYVVELMSIAPLEIPFVMAAAVVTRKYSWSMGLVYGFFGTAVSIALILPDFSITSAVFLQTAIMGVIISEMKWFSRNFTMRLSAVSFPGFVLALVLGAQLITGGISPGTLDEIRQESLEMYDTFMSEDDALNAVENAMLLFNGFFKVSLGIMFMSSLVLSWLSFHVSRWVFVRMKKEPEAVPPIYSFAVPFHAIWIFLAGLALYLVEYKPLFPVAINVLFIMAGLYGIQGLAIVTYHMKRISIGLWPRIFFWLIFFITLAFSIFILILTGILDSWVNLRSLPISQEMVEQEEKDNNDESNTQGRCQK